MSRRAQRGRQVHEDRTVSEQTPQSISGVEGVVKWFDPRKGFGFIVGPEGQDIFVHFSVIEGDGFRVLKDGSHVRYDANSSDKGWKATKVARVETAEVVVPPRRAHVRSPRR
jgi:CspA family cold shock protein